uniref:Uncharacterized protein n=1 Tax=Anopheles braziliensis TaxID=58242 RepID=A0A2M3ZMB3_9DIPT
MQILHFPAAFSTHVGELLLHTTLAFPFCFAQRYTKIHTLTRPPNSTRSVFAVASVDKKYIYIFIYLIISHPL